MLPIDAASTVCAWSLYFIKLSSVLLSYMNAAKLLRLSISEFIASRIAVIPTSDSAAASAMTTVVIARLAAAYTASPAAHAAPINGFN